MTLHTVFVSSVYYRRDVSGRIGTTEIRLGDDSAELNTVNSVVWTALYDGGFFPIGTTNNGRYLTFRRTYRNSSVPGKSYGLNEVRAYQVPNLLQKLSTVTISTDTSPSYSLDTSATNLIENLGNRSAIDDNPIQFVDFGLASYKSCFKFTETEISSDGHFFKFGFDLGDIYFQHAILIIESVYLRHPNDTINDKNKFQNYEIYIGNNSDYTQNSKCAGGPFMLTDDAANYHTWTYMGTTYTDIWNFGKEVWCNLEGRYMHIVADLSHLAG